MKYKDIKVGDKVICNLTGVIFHVNKIVTWPYYSNKGYFFLQSQKTKIENIWVGYLDENAWFDKINNNKEFDILYYL